ncbi:glycosyltransferase [Roseovarius salis]|uniref:glycosyltransferase n=1 Tax=Roseovarius salis TaxID=3376063 RepID=UPI0037CC8DC7
MRNVNRAFLFGGKIFLNVTDDVAPDKVALKTSGVSVLFERIEHDCIPPELLSTAGHFDLRNLDTATVSDPQENSPGERFVCRVNQLKDWMLNGSDTIQLSILKSNEPCSINFLNDVEIADPSKGLEFRAGIATHRADATLVMSVHDLNTGRKISETRKFNKEYTGGRLETGYQEVRLPIPQLKNRIRVSFSIQYNGYLDDGTGDEPFLFVAEPRLFSAASSTEETKTPRLLIGNKISRFSKWMVADLPEIIKPSTGLDLVVGQETTNIPIGLDVKVNLLENHGHTLVLTASQSARAVLVVDGEPISSTSLSANTVIRFPARCLNGAKRHVCLMDETGSQVLWETVTLVPKVTTPAEVMQRESPAPFAPTLFPQSAHRYASLKGQIEHANANTDLSQIAHALNVLEGGYYNVKLTPLEFPSVEQPDASIIIPAHNKVEVTYLALCSLLLARNVASFEVIVVDDASTDETATLDTIVSGITVIHNETPQRFIRACNKGADAARGNFIVLLNNDVEVTSGWLDELIAAFDRFENVGLAGAKLLYPNGELQDAGGIIWGNGNPWNYGNRQNPDDPRFSYARQADYLSGAALLIPTDVWKKIGGLSSYLEPMYFEDTDLSFKVRDQGYSTWFIPSSVIYHYEGMTSGTDISTGFKKFQEVNRPKFKRRWSKAFAEHGPEGETPDLEKDRGIVGRVLFIDYTTPRGDQDAGSYAAIQEIRLVQSLGYKVSFLPMNMAHFGTYTEELQKMGVEVLYAPFFLSPFEYLERHAGEFDAFFITRFYVAKDILTRIRELAPRAKILFNNADLHFLREIRAASAANDQNKMEQARQTRELELGVIDEVDVVLSYNDTEHSVLEAYTEGSATVVKCPWVVDAVDEVAPLAGRQGLSFLGNYRHHPNSEGLKWFVGDVMPAIWGGAGDVPLYIYGSGMTEDIKALEERRVHPVGFVQDIEDAYDQHRVFVAPLLSGAGIKGKVLGALARGLPCVLTPVAAEGIGLRHKHDCFIVERVEEWAEAVSLLMQDDALWTRLSENALSYMREAYSFEVGRERMRAAFEAADLFQSLD